MSETDPTPEESFAWAREQIAEVKAEGATRLDLDSAAGRALDRLPDEIGDLTQVEVLDLQNTQVSDLRALAGLSGLQELSLNNTQVSDLHALEGLSGLQRLWLKDTQVSDLSPLRNGFSLRWLDLSGTQVADLLPIARLRQFEEEPTDGLLRDGLRFNGTPATARDDAHRALASVKRDYDRGVQLLQYLNGEHPKFGGPPEPWVPPKPPTERQESPEHPSDHRVWIRVYGKFRVEDAAGNDLTPRSQKERGLLLMLALSTETACSRDWLRSMLWSDRDPMPGTQSLRQALSSIRRTARPGWDLLNVDRETVSLDRSRVIVDRTGDGELAEDLDVRDPAFEAWLAEMRRHERPVERLAEALKGPFSDLSFTDFSMAAQKVTVLPFDHDQVSDPTESRSHQDMLQTLETLRWAAEELRRLAMLNQLGRRDADRLGQYVEQTRADLLNARLLQMIARSVRASIKAAKHEGRLQPDDLQIAEDFVLAHHTLISEFYPEVLSTEARVAAQAIDEKVKAADILTPVQRLGGVLRDEPELVTDELRNAFDALERVCEDYKEAEDRAPLMSTQDAEAARSGFLGFAKRTGATIARLYLFVRKNWLETLGAVGSVASIASVVVPAEKLGSFSSRVREIWQLLERFFPALF